MFDTLVVFLKEFYEKVKFEKYLQTTKKIDEKLPSMQREKKHTNKLCCLLLAGNHSKNLNSNAFDIVVTRPQGYKTFIVLNSTVHGISNAQ